MSRTAGKLRNVGCYFCNDVVAPVNSTHDRTLDQQCTVSRPGTSMAVSSAVVEMLVSLLHHPLGPAAPGRVLADSPGQWCGTIGTGVGGANTHTLTRLTPVLLSPGSASSLGDPPHQVRGHMARFEQLVLSGNAYDRCTACSEVVTRAYMAGGFDFVRRVINEPKYLEDLTGLSEMHADMVDTTWAEDGDDDTTADIDADDF